MKISALMSVFLILVLAFGVVCNSEGRRGPADKEDAAKEPAKKEENKDLTTFAAWDQMTVDEHGQLIERRGKQIYYHLAKNDPAKAKCMEDKFLAEVGAETSEGMMGLHLKIRGVPEDKRANNYVEYLMAGYIVNELCGDVTSKEPAKKQENKDLTTFAEWDQMTSKETGDWVEDRTRKMYYYLAENDPAKAQCMEDRFLGELDNNEPSEGLIEFNRQINGVPKERRDKSYVEDLLAYYIAEELCGDVSSKSPDQKSK